MALIYDDLLGHRDKVQEAVDRLKAFEPPEGYFLAFSGGKDSQTIYHLAKMAGVKFDAHHTLTTVDPPELVKFVKEHYPDVSVDKSHWMSDGRGHRAGDHITMWNLIVFRSIPPTRKTRYCCADLKETKGGNRIVVTGVRWEESTNRRKTHGIVDLQGRLDETKKQAQELGVNGIENGRNSLIINNDNDETRRLVEFCYRQKKTTVNPIVDWSEEDVWEFLNDVAKVPHCSLYEKGFKRLGCIGCPMIGTREREKEFEVWPVYKQNYLRAFDRMLKAMEEEGECSVNWKNAQECFEWWMYNANV